MTKEITKAMEKEYVDHGGVKCLFCGGEDGVNGVEIVGGPVEIDGPDAWQDVSCGNCGNSWRDCYKLVSVLPL